MILALFLQFLILGTTSLFYDPSSRPFSFKSFLETLSLQSLWLQMTGYGRNSI